MKYTVAKMGVAWVMMVAGCDVSFSIGSAEKESSADEPAEEAIVAEPVVGEPVVAEPVVGEPVVAEPVVGEPVVAKPVVARPASVDPPPVVPEPATERRARLPDRPAPEPEALADLSPAQLEALVDELGEQGLAAAAAASQFEHDMTMKSMDSWPVADDDGCPYGYVPSGNSCVQKASGSGSAADYWP